MLSPLATVIPSPRGGNPRSGIPFGVALHTTGSGLPRDALARGEDPFRYGIQWYREHGEGPTYLIGWDGQIAAIVRDEGVRTSHIGIQSDELRPIHDGSWRALVPPQVAAQWNLRWGAARNPPDLIGGALPNDAVIGVEMIPVTDGSSYWAMPMRAGLRFTRAQHVAARQLVADIASRYGWPAGWQRTRVFGHEDLNPIRRSDAGGGWDPGRLRNRPYIDMDHITGSGLAPVIVGALLAAGALLWWQGRR